MNKFSKSYIGTDCEGSSYCNHFAQIPENQLLGKKVQGKELPQKKHIGQRRILHNPNFKWTFKHADREEE